MLVHGRKFDLRVFGMLTSVNKRLKGWFYKDCYIRTSSLPYNNQNLGNRLVHLTNDAVQKYGDDYGKFENGNKLSISDF